MSSEGNPQTPDIRITGAYPSLRHAYLLYQEPDGPAHKQAALLILLHIYILESYLRLSQCSVERVHTIRPQRNPNHVRHLPSSAGAWSLIPPLVSLVTLLCLHTAPSVLNSVAPTANGLSCQIPSPNTWIDPGWIRGHPAPANCGPGDGR